MDRALTGGDGCVAILMARASTDVLSVAALAAPRPPPRALIIPLTPLSCLIDALVRRSG
jgi:hypothetical protein